MAKFTQNPSMKAFLLSTGDSVLVEASPLDKIWGIGLKMEDSKAMNEHEWRGHPGGDRRQSGEFYPRNCVKWTRDVDSAPFNGRKVATGNAKD